MNLEFLNCKKPFLSSLSSSAVHCCRFFRGELPGDSDLRFPGLVIAATDSYWILDDEGRTFCFSSGLILRLFLLNGAIESLSSPEKIDDWLAGGELFGCWRTRGRISLVLTKLLVGAPIPLALSDGAIESPPSVTRFNNETRLLSSSSSSESLSEFSLGSERFSFS